MQTPLRVHFALVLVAILFSVSYVIAKVAMVHMSALSFAYLRVLGSALILVSSAGVRRGASVVLERADHLKVVLYSILAVVLNQTLFLAGLSLTTAHQAAILISSIPMFTFVGALLFGRERATTLKIIGIALAAAGALLVLTLGPGPDSEGSTLGNALILMNCLSYGLYLVLSKRTMFRLGPRRVVTYLFAYGSFLMLPISALSLSREKWESVPPSAWIALLAVILGPTVAAYVLNAWALARAESSLVAAYTYLQPVLASALAAIFLQEHISGWVIIAAVLIFTGVYLTGAGTGEVAIPPGGAAAPPG